jgi:hypothetical protein
MYLLKEKFRTICDKLTERTQAQRFLWAWIGKALSTDSCYLGAGVPIQTEQV